MTLEDELFKKTTCNFNELITYGFKKEKYYTYTTLFLEDQFKAVIRINDQGKVLGQVFDVHFDEEYIVFRISNKLGKYAYRIKEAYIHLLEDIKQHCFTELNFMLPQSNRLEHLIYASYGNTPEFLWESSPNAGVFRNPDSDKWYGIIMELNQAKLGREDKQIEVLNVKLDEQEIQKLLNENGFYPAYHMNRKNWISIILDDTLSDDLIMSLIKKSHQFTEILNEWIVPGNPKFYDMLNCFKESDTMLWKQSSNIKKGHLVYLYVGAPISALLYQCIAIEVDLPFDYDDDNLTMKKVMKIKCLKTYSIEDYPFKRLNQLGIKAIRGPRRITKELSEALNKE